MKDDYVAETTTIRLIEASLGREDVADRANFRYMYSSSQPNSFIPSESRLQVAEIK